MSNTTANVEFSPAQVQDATRRIDYLFALQQKNRWAISQSSAKSRIRKLKKLQDTIFKYKEAIQDALFADFRKPSAEVNLSEIYPTLNEIKYAIANLENWLKPQSVGTPTALLGSSSYVLPEAKGVCLIIASWNYPFNITFAPLVSAIAAGNCAILKPSEFAPHTARLMAEMIAEMFPEDEIALVEGDTEVSKYLLEKPFDHIFFTGSTQVGKIVMQAAAKNLTSVTLELGGKSPTIIDETANLEEAAKKIAWGKFTNAGQTCIAPDYILVQEEKEELFIELLLAQIQKFYGETPQERLQSPDFARIISEKHCNRLATLIGKAKGEGALVRIGGTMALEDRYIAPTVLSEVKPDSEIMKEEIFGPVLPILRYKNLEDAISLIQSKDKPLALYIFSQNGKNVDQILAQTSAGGTCINDTLVHYFQHELPFGGVNQSGIGKAHGYFGFLEFSNQRAVLKQPTRFSAAQLMYPPYKNEVKTLIDFSMKWI
ncbi:aldehyde dehydrogenase family protein [Hugenholtzia roseola]|uniref:aldehyde dehydrogenase family protein n=1 Tax=Hugenholtzia roseola TaxID=1002 RepID=UPI00041BFE03|nr:aldehyde dehydrogenase family protein [Hugenholtzia roseola]